MLWILSLICWKLFPRNISRTAYFSKCEGYVPVSLWHYFGSFPINSKASRTSSQNKAVPQWGWWGDTTLHRPRQQLPSMGGGKRPSVSYSTMEAKHWLQEGLPRWALTTADWFCIIWSSCMSMLLKVYNTAYTENSFMQPVYNTVTITAPTTLA